MENREQQAIVRFLLGDLPEDNRLKLEERLFRDDAFYEQVLATQEELADDYVQEKLSVEERQQFEKYFLRSPRRRERVEFAAAFSGALSAGKISGEAVRPTPGWWESLLSFVRPRLVLATSAAALALLVGVSLLVLENRRLSHRLEQARIGADTSVKQWQANASTAEQKAQELEREIAALRARGGEMEAQIQQKQRDLDTLQRNMQSARSVAANGVVATFVLSPGLTRGTDEPEKVIVSPGVRSIKLQLNFERDENYKTYLAEIRTARGNLVWSRNGLTVQRIGDGQAVSITIPATLLSTGEYEVALKGAAQRKFDVVGYYYLIALKK